MFRVILLLLITTAVSASVSCSTLATMYSESDCCSGTNVPCLQQIPSCSAPTVIAGEVCIASSGKLFVKGLNDAFNFSQSNQITLKKHIIPDTNGAYDLGNAEYKIRYLFETD